MRNRIFPGVILVAVCFSSAPAQGTGAGADFFERKIRPVLVESCYECHSEGSKKIKGGLRVDGRAELLRGGDEGPAIVPGKPNESRLILAMSHRDPDLAMPPKKPKLSDGIIHDFERWIEGGAIWPGDTRAASPAKTARGFDLEARKRKQPWLWQAPARQSIPDVKQKRWPTTETDFFIMARLEAAGLRPAPAADDRTWLRRVYFAVTGLPPSVEDIARFLADQKEGARERVVDELLASPQFGERWARHWMDLVRYAESRGHEGDYSIANAWHYRDYLIRAWNSGLPYDQFVMEHVAGDLLPPRLHLGANQSALATGWAFLGEENHSPVDIRQDECERIDNKIDVFSKTFLGLTVSCARCHDHKFDPISAQDYYGLAGYLLGSSFRQVRFEAMENNREMATELAALRTEFQSRLVKETAEAREGGVGKIAESLLSARAVITGDLPASGVPAMTQAWVDYLSQARTNQTGPLAVFAKAALDRATDEPERFADLMHSNRVASVEWNPKSVRIVADYTKPGLTPWKVDGEAFGRKPAAAGEIVFGHATNSLAGVMSYGAARRDLFWKGLKTTLGNEDDSGRLGATRRAGQMLRTPTVTLEAAKLHFLIRGKTRVYAAVDSHLMNEGPLHGQLSQSFDGGPRPRWVTHDLTPYTGHRVHVEFGPDGESELEVLMVVEAAEAPKWLPDTIAFIPDRVSSVAAFARDFEQAVARANQSLSRGECLENPALADFLIRNPQLFETGAKQEAACAQKEFLERQNEIARRVRWESRTAVALFDGTGVDENILIRGKPFKPGAKAPRSLPAAFPGAKATTTAESSGRLELARQMVDESNPLVARVFVNRVWHHLFGRGIVASVDNFGELGERPTHPELLDHLAWQFVHEDNWSAKRLIRRLVLSSAFAMSSRVESAEAEEKDPRNHLWHRMEVRRLEGEAIRDNLLAVSGRLSRSVGGAPEPLYLTEFLVGRGRPEKSGALDGNGRRSVYLAMRRNFLPSLQMTFDAPTPFSSVGKRNVTNVPGQFLALMNDPLFHQQAKVWKENVFGRTPGMGDEKRIELLFESAYGRLPTSAEMQSTLRSLAELRELREAGESEDAWVDLCHALLNANEFIYVR